MLDQSQNLEESEDLKEVDESAEDISNDSADFIEAPIEDALPKNRITNDKSVFARKFLEEYREERALRMAIYDDLYGFDEEE